MTTPTADRATVRARLEGAALDELVGITVDHVLDRPVAELVDAAFLADQLRLALETASRDPRTRAFLREQLDAARSQVPAGRPRDTVPEEVLAPLRTVLGREIIFERALVGRLLDHDAARHLVTDLLQTSIRRYVDKLKPMASTVASSVQKSSSFGRLKMLGQGVRGIGEGVLGGVSKELEHRAEAKVREFVDSALHTAMDQVADHACDPANAARYARYRVHVLETLLDTENARLTAELEKFDPDSIVDLGLELAAALSRRDDLQDQLVRMVEQALQSTAGRTVRDYLHDTGFADDTGEGEWRAALEERIAAEARHFVQGPAFSAWLDRLLAP
jgi:hypothetical protein